MAQILIKSIGISLPQRLKQDLDIFIDDVLNSEMDMVIVVDGKEGTGKSRTARVIGKYIGYKVKANFSDKSVSFQTDEYIKKAETGEKFQINVLDESREALNKKRGMSKSNVKFTNWLSENRDRQQFHILVLPAIHDLDTYVTMWRMSLLIHHLKYHKPNEKAMSGYKLERGYFRVFENNKDLQQVIFNKARYGYYAYPKYCKYHSRFRDNEPFSDVEMKAYKEKKATQRAEKYSSVEKKSKEHIVLQKLLVAVKQKHGISSRDVEKYTDGACSHNWVASFMRKGKDESML